VSRNKATDESQMAEAPKLVIGKSATAYEAAQAAIGQWWDYNVTLGQREGDAAISDKRAANWVLLTAAGVSLLIAMAAVIVMSRNLLGQLGGEPAQAVAIANRIARGDLSQQVRTKRGDASSIVAALGLMQERLRAIVGQKQRHQPDRRCRPPDGPGHAAERRARGRERGGGGEPSKPGRAAVHPPRSLPSP
jgi:methyl-accepting chemotaxis protein